MATFPFSVEKWRKWLELAQSQIDGGRDPFPIDRALRWVQLESGGNVCSVGRVDNGHVYEAGLAQTYFSTPDSVVFGVTSEQLRAVCGGSTTMPTNLTDSDRLFHARIAMLDMRAHRAKARNKLQLVGASLPERGRDFWCFVKLTHALPGMYSYLAPAKRFYGRFPTWSEYRQYVESLSNEELVAIDRGTARYVGAFQRVFRNCEHFADVPGGVSSSSGFVELELLVLLAAAAFLLTRYVG